MINELLISITAGMIAVLPPPIPPDVVVPSNEIEISVVQFIQEQEKRTVTIECNFLSDQLTLKEEHPQNFICLTVDKQNQEKFNTLVVLSTVEGKVNIAATVEKQDGSKIAVIPTFPPPISVDPIPTPIESTPNPKKE